MSLSDDERIVLTVGRLHGLLRAGGQVNNGGKLCVMVELEEANKIMGIFSDILEGQKGA